MSFVPFENEERTSLPPHLVWWKCWKDSSGAHSESSARASEIETRAECQFEFRERLEPFSAEQCIQFLLLLPAPLPSPFCVDEKFSWGETLSRVCACFVKPPSSLPRCRAFKERVVNGRDVPWAILAWVVVCAGSY